MIPYWSDDAVILHHGDCLDVMRELPDNSVDSVVTDPPYGLGFMGREWDSLPPGLPWALECLRVLKPGGHLLAFGGTRTWHRLAVAVEDAGFEIRDSIAWLYGSGFPKSLDVSKAIDKAAGVERPVVGPNPRAAQQTVTLGSASLRDKAAAPAFLTGPATDSARQWEGWGTAMKPSHEPVVCAQKPFNMVPFKGEAIRLHHLIGGLLWLSLSPAKRAELSSMSSRVAHKEAWCASALASAAAASSPGASDVTGMYSSLELASTFSNIVSSWSVTLDALSGQTTTFTTSTRSSTTTDLRTLNSLLGPLTSQTTMPPCGCLHGGGKSSAPSVENGSTDEWARWLHTLSASVPERAIEGIALAVESALAQVAASLSGDLAVGSSAPRSATTEVAGSSSHFEPCVVARKPLIGTVAANVTTHGTGALNIDGCRVGTAEDKTKAPTKRGDSASWFTTNDAGNLGGDDTKGRWPANVVLDENQAAELDASPGGRSVNGPATWSTGTAAGVFGSVGNAQAGEIREGYGDAGGPSRFFPTFRYEAKAPTEERPRVDGVAHPTVKPLDLMRWLVRLVTPPGGVVLEPFAGSGTTAEACVHEHLRCIAIEREAEYLPLIIARLTKPMEIGFDFGDAA